MSILTRKPHPDALPSIYGWFLPKTGELLVSIKGLENPVEGYKPNTPYSVLVEQKTPEPEPVVAEKPKKSKPVEKEIVPNLVEEKTYTADKPVNASVEEQLNFLAESGIVTMPTEIENIKSKK